MRSVCAMGLTMLLCWQPIVAVAAVETAPAGPLARSMSREAGRLAAESAAGEAASGWGVFRALEPGRRIVVMTSTTTLTGAFVTADDSTLTVRRNESTERLDADDILLVSGTVRRGSAGAAVLGTLGGIWLGSGLAFGLAENSRCYRSCGGVRLAIWSAMIGVPIAGGYGAWYGTSRLTEEVIYRRPSSALSGQPARIRR